MRSEAKPNRTTDHRPPTQSRSLALPAEDRSSTPGQASPLRLLRYQIGAAMLRTGLVRVRIGWASAPPPQHDPDGSAAAAGLASTASAGSLSLEPAPPQHPFAAADWEDVDGWGVIFGLLVAFVSSAGTSASSPLTACLSGLGRGTVLAVGSENTQWLSRQLRADPIACFYAQPNRAGQTVLPRPFN